MTKDEYWKRMAKRTLKELRKTQRALEDNVVSFSQNEARFGRRLSECEAAIVNLIREKNVLSRRLFECEVEVVGSFMRESAWNKYSPDVRVTALTPLVTSQFRDADPKPFTKEDILEAKARFARMPKIPEPVDLDEALQHLPDGPASGASHVYENDTYVYENDSLEEARMRADMVRAQMEKEAREAELAGLSYYDDKGRPWKEAYAEMQANYERQLEALSRRLEAL